MRRVARPLLYVVTVATVLALGQLHASYVGYYDFTASNRFTWVLAYAGVLCVAAYSVGLPDLPRSARGSLLASATAVGVSAVGVSLVQLLAGSLLLPRYVVFGGALALVPAYMAIAAIAGSARGRAEDRARVLAVVSPNEAERLTSELRQRPERPAALVGVVDPADGDALPAAAAACRATVIVLDRVAQADERTVSAATELHAHGIRVRTLTLFYEQWLGKLPLSELERVSLLFDIRELHQPVYARTKRLVDVALALVGCAALVLVVPAVLVGNAVASRGPTLFRQQRVGKGGVTFTIVKFRTMRPGPSAGDWTSLDDPRVTRFGRWLRRTHLDELPQVINVLAGSLSIVGPRPEQRAYVDELTEKLPFYALRHLVRPGLTGWAQVKYAYGASDVDAAEKLQYEMYYLRHQGFRLDAQIIGRTLRAMVSRSGR